ncbi:hypothetical protein P7C73_g1011, partial [Tremellales sp. Uapishka_1]
MISYNQLLTLLLLPLLSEAAPARSKRAITPITDGSTVSGNTYNYVIAGGGLAGSVLASRLTEDSSVTVLVIEAGFDQESNTGVTGMSPSPARFHRSILYETDPANYQATFGSDIDWAYQTVDQANGVSQTMRSGKALGGSTTINGMAWSKPHTFQMLMAEDFEAPSSAQLADGVTYDANCRGTGGPIGTQYSTTGIPAHLEDDFNTTVQSLGLPYETDLTCGDPAGAGPISDTTQGGFRIDAYRGYLYGKTRPNLTILSGANVGKVLLSSDSTPQATGLEFQDENGNTYIVSASDEVIMATGSIKTPVILQQSGIGPSDVLSNAGVTPVLDLPVGLNLIDQTTVTTDWTFKGKRGGGQDIMFPRFQDLVAGDDAATLSDMLQNDLETYAQANVDAGATFSASGLQTILQIQADWILNQSAGIAESFDYSFSKTLGYDSWYLLPFGRGSIKIQDDQAYASNFNIDPRYFSNPFDRLAQGATVRFTRTVSSATPLSNDVTAEDTPGTSAVPSSSSLDDWATWAENNYRSNWHPIGTCAMMNQSMGGVVDSNYKVYGVDGLRVVDGSVLPFQVSAHLMTVLYGLSERAADIIKTARNGTTSA